MTPMLKQYYQLKEKCDGAILFFRMGDFYELFGADAELVAPLLEIVLTSREKGDNERIPFCGVPHHSAKNYFFKLLQKGFKVAIAEQVGDKNQQSAKGIMEREISVIYTPGLVDEAEGLDSFKSNFIAAIYECPIEKNWHTVGVDLSTGGIIFFQEQCYSQLLKRTLALEPREIWARSFFHEKLENDLKKSAEKLNIESLSEVVLRSESVQHEILKNKFNLFFKQFSNPSAKIAAASVLAATMSRIKSLGHSLDRFVNIKNLDVEPRMELSIDVQRDLELFETQIRRDRSGSLFSTINFTVSPMGFRLLADNLRRPLAERSEIEKRQDFVSLLVSLGETKLTEIRQILTPSYDLERIITRAVSKKARPRELLGMLAVIKKLSKLTNQYFINDDFKNNFVVNNLNKSLGELANLRTLLETSLSEDAQDIGSGDLVFKLDYFPKLKELNELAKNGQSKVDDYLEKTKKETGINSLKIKRHNNFGLLLEVTKTNLSKVPDFFIRRQTMVNNERFATEELVDLSQLLDSAHDQAVQLECDLYLDLLEKIAIYHSAILTLAKDFAHFDLLQSFAYLALREKFIKPLHNVAGNLELKNNRHPVVERFVGKGAFVANDIEVAVNQKHLLITGPNMAGKSTIMRQVAITAILNQIGSFVPADFAKLPIFDQIFTRIGSADDLSQGKSTFMVEMSEAAEILSTATSKSLVLFDEIGRGTSTQDGLALAAAILVDLVSRIDCYTLFATHYHELVPISSKYENIKIVQTEVLENTSGVSFTHRLITGASGNSYGLEVAKLAGLPVGVIKNAHKFLSDSKSYSLNKIPVGLNPIESEKENISEVTGLASLVGRDSRVVTDVINKIEMLKIHRLTPLAALNILNDFKMMLESPGQEELPFNSFLDV